VPSPVLSVHQTDVIYYGDNLVDHIAHDSGRRLCIRQDQTECGALRSGQTYLRVPKAWNSRPLCDAHIGPNVCTIGGM
jgi:hypothetical protein